jgi:hypothetical protein
MTFKEEAEFRIKCCREKTKDGYGELHSLENFLFNPSVNGRIGELRKFKEDAKEVSALKNDPIYKELMRELEDLLSLRSQARILINSRRAEDGNKADGRAEADHRAVW